MDMVAQVFLAIGGLLLVGLLAEGLGRFAAVPRVTLLLIVGVLLGPEAADLLPPFIEPLFEGVADVALLMIGFLLGERFTPALLRAHGKEILVISAVAATVTGIVVTLVLWGTGAGLVAALLLGGVAPATDPAATVDVVEQSGARSGFTDRLLGIVALDDAWGLLLFSLALSVAVALAGRGGETPVVTGALREILGAAALGVVLGWPAAKLSGRIQPGEPTLLEALGLVLVCGGLARWLEVSFLLAAMVMGAVLANFARHHKRPFHEIKHIERPFLVLFFILAGAQLELDSLRHVGLVGGAYLAARVAGKMLGGWMGGRLGGSDARTCRWLGLAMVPQAGVAMGMTLVALQRLPDSRDLLLPVVVGSTVVFELVGPILTQVALRRAGDQAPGS